MSKANLPCKYKIETPQGQYIFDKLMKDLDGAMFFLSVIFFNENKELSVQIATEFESKLESVQTKLQSFIETSQNKFETDGFLKCTYTDVYDGIINLQTRASRKYLQLIETLDSAISYLDSYWLQSAMTDTERHEKIHEIQHKVYEVAIFAFEQRDKLGRLKTQSAEDSSESSAKEELSIQPRVEEITEITA